MIMQARIKAGWIEADALPVEEDGEVATEESV